MTNLKGLLRTLGFSPLAEKIYLNLINKGPANVAELAQVCGKFRPAVYKALPALLTANLVTKVTKGKRIVYKAESPAAISALVKKQAKLVEDILPDLVKTFQQKDQKPKISFFEGKEGIATVYEQLVAGTPKGGAIWRYEAARDYKKNKRYYPSLYWKRAGSTGDIDKYVITNLKTHQKRHQNLNRLSKAVTGPFEENITELIGNDKVVFVDYDTETAIVIENERFAEFQKTIFKMLFEKI